MKKAFAFNCDDDTEVPTNRCVAKGAHSAFWLHQKDASWYWASTPTLKLSPNRREHARTSRGS